MVDPTKTGTADSESSPALPPRRRKLGRIVLTLALIGLGLALILTIGIHQSEPPRESSFVVREQRPQPRAEVPDRAIAAPEDRRDASDQAELDAWARRVSQATEIPPRVLAAYGRAEMWMRSEQPGCHLSWGTLAGIGRVESHHGSYGGSEVGADGVVREPIIGLPLDGSPGIKAIPDTDGGRLDGDTTWDRAVGPMQFLPQTWREWSVRAVQDGAPPDPQNIDDAALAAARYLCSNSADLSTPEGWWNAVLTYNESVEYAQDVFSGAQAYATADITQ